MSNVDTTILEKGYQDRLNRFSFHGKTIPEHMHGGIIRYLVHKIPPGDFLTSVLSNDLFGAISKADDININALPVYCAFFYNETPTSCWGSKERVNAWLSSKENI